MRKILICSPEIRNTKWIEDRWPTKAVSHRSIDWKTLDFKIRVMPYNVHKFMLTCLLLHLAYIQSNKFVFLCLCVMA